MKIDVMTKDKDTKTVVPALRFPEFRDGEGWKIVELNKACTINPTTKELPDSFVYIDLESVQDGKLLQKKIIKKHSAPSRAQRLLNKGDIIYQMVRPYQKNNYFFTLENELNYVASTGYAQLRAFQSNSYIYQYIHTDEFVNQVIEKCTGSNYPAINSSDLSKMILPIPNISEQEKVADCLGSMDDLISSVADKIETLKEYKKGLMQQLFPAEGKTIPAIRFPEFQNAGEWEVDNEFSQYIKLYRGSSPRPIKEYLTQDIDGVNWIKIGDTKSSKNYIINNVEEKITQKGSTKSRYVYQGELILANSMSFGKTYLLEVEGCIYDGWFVLREYENNYYKPFLLHLLNSEYMQNQYLKLSAGGIVLNISSDIVYQTKLPHTSIDEQQKIADCLSSVDELISTETAKLDQLKKHKKGLMQQLFPKLQ